MAQPVPRRPDVRVRERDDLVHGSEMGERGSERVHLPAQRARIGHDHGDGDPRKRPRDFLDPRDGGVFGIVHHDDESVSRVPLGQEGSHVVVEPFVEPSDRQDHRDRGQVRAVRHPHPTADAGPEPDSLDQGDEVRDQRQDREDREPEPEEVESHRAANLPRPNKSWRSRADEDVIAVDAHLERAKAGHRVRDVGARPHVVLPSVVGARDDRVEQSIGKLDDRLTKEEQGTAFKEIFEWLGATPEVPPNSYTREWARELLAAIGAMVQYDKYEGSADTYIV